MAGQLLPYVDIPPEPFASRLLFLAASIRPSYSVEELVLHLVVPEKKDWTFWKQRGNLQSENIAMRTKVWGIWAESLIDLLFTHALIDFAALHTGRFPSGVSFGSKDDFTPAYLWLRAGDVWWFICHLMSIPPERWLLKDCTAAQLSLLEGAVKRWGEAFLYPRHVLPEVVPPVPRGALNESVAESTDAVHQLEHAIERLFAWLEAWQKCPYDTLDLLHNLGELAKVYYEVYNSLVKLFLHSEQAGEQVTSATSASSQVCAKVTARLVYLMVGNEVSAALSVSELAELPLTIYSSPYDAYLKYRFRTALRQSYRLVRLIHQLGEWEKPSEDYHDFVDILHGICDFWEWHGTEVVGRILPSSSETNFKDYVALSTQQEAELEAHVRRYLLGKGCIKRYQNLLARLEHERHSGKDHSNKRVASPIVDWTNQFAQLPYNAVDLVQAVNELQKHVWAYHKALAEQWLAKVSNRPRG